MNVTCLWQDNGKRDLAFTGYCPECWSTPALNKNRYTGYALYLYAYEYPHTAVDTDIVNFTVMGNALKVLLIKRGLFSGRL